MRRWFAVLLLAALPACSIGQVLTDLREESPPPELGRPGWVRYSARGGALLGAGTGATRSARDVSSHDG